jgi:2,5-diketo-D-gluconate reductase A
MPTTATSKTASSPSLKLNDGRAMPQIGLGLMRFGGEGETVTVINNAVDAGYRLFDTAAVYGTEPQTGEAFKGLHAMRSDFFLTTKLWNDSQGKEAPLRAFNASMDRLGLDYLDLYLVHWPLPKIDRYVDTWRAMLTLRKEGRVRSIGVSNFTEQHLQRIIDETGEAPAVNQVEMHPYFQQRSLRSFHDRHGIVTQAWSPLGGSFVKLREEPVLATLAKKHGRTPSEIVLAWHVSCAVSFIPKATSPKHLADNMAAFQVKLDKADLEALSKLDRTDGRAGPDPDTFDRGAQLND